MSNKKYKKPRKFVYKLARFAVYPFVKHKYNIHCDRSEIKGVKPPYILLANHGTNLDPLFLFGAMKHVYMSPVGGYAYFKNKKMKWFLKQMNAIPKFQYQTDLKAMKDMLNVTRHGGVLALFPTGRNSSCGEGFPIPDSLAKLVKMSKVPVVVAKINGSYLSKPKWAKDIRKGRIDIKITQLFNAEQVKTLEIEEMTAKLKEALDFNDYEWNKKELVKYKCKNPAEDLHNILYRCPHCGQEFEMSSSKDILRCNHCGQEFRVNEYGFFDQNEYFENPLQYYEWQRNSINELISNPFKIEDNVVCLMNREKGQTPVGEGKIEINNESIIYRGTIDNEVKEITFPLKDLFSLPYRCGVNIEIALDLDIYQFKFENPYLPTKFCLIVEELYKKN